MELSITKASRAIDQIAKFNEIVQSFQNEHRYYLQELEIVIGKIKSIFDNPNSGVNGDTVDVIFGNISDILKIETAVKQSLEEVKIISPPKTLQAVASVFYSLAKTASFSYCGGDISHNFPMGSKDPSTSILLPYSSEQLHVYVYYGNNFSASLDSVDYLRQHKDALKYSFEDCVKLAFSEDTITILLDVLLFKPITYAAFLFDTIRDLISCLKNVAVFDSETLQFALIQKEMLRESLVSMEETETGIQDIMDKYYDEYRYYPLYLVSRNPHTIPPLLLYKGYMCMIVEKKMELKLVEITEETITISILDKENRDVILMKQKYSISNVLSVKDFHNDLNQLSITLQDQTIQFLPSKSEDKDDVVVALTVLLSRRVFLPKLASEQHRSMSSEYDEVHSEPCNSDPLLANSLDSLITRLILGSVTEPKFTEEFLTVYKLFTTSWQLFDLLQDRFHKYTNETKKENFAKDKTNKLKVFGVLKTWLLLDKRDFMSNGLLASNLGIFLDNCKKTEWLVKWVRLLEKILEDSPDDDTMTSDKPTKVAWYLTSEPSKFSLLTLHPLELARQITLIEHNCFAKMQLYDIIANTGDGVSKLRDFQDRYGLWMRRSLVDTRSLEERIATFRCLFEVMKTLHDMRNYSGMMVVYNVVHCAEIYRLKHSIRKMLYKFQHTLAKVESMSKDNYASYWNDLERSTLPAVPMIGLYSQYVKDADLTFKTGEVVNLEACLKFVEKSITIKALQEREYLVSTEDSIKKFLLELCPYERKTRKAFLSDLYDRSLTVEPFGGPPSFFSKTTVHTFDTDPDSEYFGWKSTSVKPKTTKVTVSEATEKFNRLQLGISDTDESESEDDDTSRARMGSTLKKSKSFCSRKLDEPPPIPPRPTAIRKSNCLTRSQSFNTERRSPYDMYVLPNKMRQPVSDRESPHYLQRSPSPIYAQHTSDPIYGQNSSTYLQNSPTHLLQNGPVYAQVHNPPVVERTRSPVLVRNGSSPLSSPLTNNIIQNRPKQRMAVRPVVRCSVKQRLSPSPSPPARRHRTSTKIPRPVQGCEGPPALPLKTIRRKVFSKKMEYVEPEESYDTIENYPLRPPPIPPPIPPKQKPPPVPPRN